MKPFQEAAQLNNQGIALLLDGDEDNAILAMTRSIRIMKEEIAKPEKEIQDFVPPSGQVAYPNLSTVEIPQPRPQDGSNAVATDRALAVFNQAIHIPCVEEQQDSSLVDIHVCSAAVIFNLALTHHLQALQSKLVDPRCIIKACKLYSMVLKLLEGTPALRDRTALLIKLATTNNLAQLRIASGDYDIARLGLSHLESFVGRANQSLLNEPQVQRLLASMMLMKGPKVAPAA